MLQLFISSITVVLVMLQFPHQWRPIKPSSTRYLLFTQCWCVAYTTLAFSHSSRRPTFNLEEGGKKRGGLPIRIHELKVSRITIKRWLKADKKLQSHVQMNWLIIRCLECCCLGCSVKSSRPTKDDSIREPRDKMMNPPPNKWPQSFLNNFAAKTWMAYMESKIISYHFCSKREVVITSFGQTISCLLLNKRMDLILAKNRP